MTSQESLRRIQFSSAALKGMWRDPDDVSVHERMQHIFGGDKGMQRRVEKKIEF